MNQKRQEVMKATQNLYKFSLISGRLQAHFFKTWYCVILQRRFTYACAGWYPRISYQHVRRPLFLTQRNELLLMSRAYRNNSTNVLQVLTGLSPLSLQLEAEAEFSRESAWKSLLGIFSHLLIIQKDLNILWQQRLEWFSNRPIHTKNFP